MLNVYTTELCGDRLILEPEANLPITELSLACEPYFPIAEDNLIARYYIPFLVSDFSYNQFII